jgi:hypothetical protein
MQLYDITGLQPEKVADGTLRLFEDRIEVATPKGDKPLDLGLDDVSAISVDLRRALLIRGPERLYEAVLPVESPLKWELMGQHWLSVARDRRKKAG